MALIQHIGICKLMNQLENTKHSMSQLERHEKFLNTFMALKRLEQESQVEPSLEEVAACIMQSISCPMEITGGHQSCVDDCVECWITFFSQMTQLK